MLSVVLFLDEDRRSKSLCRWIGPANNIGQAMCWFVIIKNGEYLVRSSVIEVDKLAMQTPELQSQMEEFTSNLESKIGNNKNLFLILASLMKYTISHLGIISWKRRLLHPMGVN